MPRPASDIASTPDPPATWGDCFEVLHRLWSAAAKGHYDQATKREWSRLLEGLETQAARTGWRRE